MRNKISFLISMVIAGMLLGGCSDSAKPAPPAPVAPTPIATTPTVTAPVSAATVTSAPSSTVAAPVAYAYNPQGRRDPFTPLILKEEKKAFIGARTPLERYAIHEFKLAGIVWGGLGYHAMLEGPDGKGYFVKEKTIIGPNRGIVRRITQSNMIVEERYRDPSGEMKKKEIVIELRKSQEGTP